MTSIDVRSLLPPPASSQKNALHTHTLDDALERRFLLPPVLHPDEQRRDAWNAQVLREKKRMISLTRRYELAHRAQLEAVVAERRRRTAAANGSACWTFTLTTRHRVRVPY